MNADERFVELWNDYLEGELDESRIAELQALVAGDNRRLQVATDSYQIHRLLGLIAQDSSSRQDDFVSETLARLPADHGHFVDGVRQRLAHGTPPQGTPARMRPAKWPAAIAAAAVLALVASLTLLQPNVAPEIARITGLSGSVQWTGDRGRVAHDVEVGSSLSGGMLESLPADSWGTLAFHDGSTITISGQSMLTISEREQKELYLRVGSLSASVLPQPIGRPMLIHTPTAKLEVLGTQFTVKAGPASTILRVSEGRVRVTRLVDGRVTEVPAEHQLVVSANRMAHFGVIRPPKPVRSWQSRLPSGARYGEWLPELGDGNGGLRARPIMVYRPRLKKLFTLYRAELVVSHGQSAPVVLTSGRKFRIRGHIESAGEVHFGLTAHHAAGGLAGDYAVARRLEVKDNTGGPLDVELHLEDFRPQGERLPDSPIGLILVYCWCFTLDVDAGLSISSVELIQAEP